MSENNKIKVTLKQIIELDSTGNPMRSIVKVKNVNGVIEEQDLGLSYKQNDVFVLSQLMSTVDNKTVSVGEYKTVLSLDDKCIDAIKRDKPEIELELSLDESALLKRLLNNLPADYKARTFHIRTICGVLEQLK